MSESYFWVVIYDEASYDSAVSISEKLKGEGKVVWMVEEKSKVVPALYLVASIVCVGLENHWSEILANQCNPTADIKLTDDGYIDHATSQFVFVNPDGVEEPFSIDGHGIIGEAKRMRPRLKLYVIMGGDANCTASVTKAFIEAQPAAIYATPDATNYSQVSTPQAQNTQ